MAIVAKLSVGIISALASVALAQTAPNGHSASQSKQQSPSQHSSIEAAMDSLIGRSIYACYLYPPTSPMARSNPEFFDGTDVAGKQISSPALAGYFHTGDHLIIRAAESDMTTITERWDSKSHPSVFVSLAVENQANKVTAGVQVEVYKADVTPARLFSGIVHGIWFSRTPVKTIVEIGMTRDEVECAFSVPEHTNTDATGGDQMVYWGGKMYVYISPRTDRVTNVQTSF
jgi:hypothetical protein